MPSAGATRRATNVSLAAEKCPPQCRHNSIFGAHLIWARFAGGVREQDKGPCLKDLEELFSSLEIDGKKVIKHIYRKQDIYAGPYLDQAPDMILLADKGFNLKGSMASEQLAGKGPFTGKHTYPDAFLLVSNKDHLGDFTDQPSVIDAGKFIKSRVSRS